MACIAAWNLNQTAWPVARHYLNGNTTRSLALAAAMRAGSLESLKLEALGFQMSEISRALDLLMYIL